MPNKIVLYSTVRGVQLVFDLHCLVLRMQEAPLQENSGV